MNVEEPIEFEGLLKEVDRDECLLFSERNGASFDTITGHNKITAIFGPKGGWEDQELAAARDSNIRIVTLGGRVLRAETAAIAILAILQHRFGDFN
jgi:16S rRNA (uracil1498-N3)-methyltransferase